MIIDSHTHAARGKGTIKEFLTSMDEHHIDISVLCALGGDEESVKDSNAYIHELVQAHPDRLIGYATVMPTQPGATKLLDHYINDLGFRGLKLHPPMQNFNPTDPAIEPVIEKCIELKIPILFHTGPIFAQKALTSYGDPALIDELAIRFPEAIIIMAHGDPLGWDPSIAAKHPNVYIDTTLRFARLAKLIPGLGEDLLDWMRTDEKLIFGTDANPTRTWRFKYNLDPILDMDVTEETRNKILGGTISKLLKLEQ